MGFNLRKIKHFRRIRLVTRQTTTSAMMEERLHSGRLADQWKNLVNSERHLFRQYGSEEMDLEK